MGKILRSCVLVSAALLSTTTLVACGGSSEDNGNQAGAGGSAGEAGVPDVSSDVAPDSPENDGGNLDEFAIEASVDVTPDVAPTCAAPSDPTKSALCLDLTPEKITPVPSDEKFDGMGVFIVEVYDTPLPDLADGGAVKPLAITVLPDQDGGVNPPITVNLFDPIDTIRFDNLPASTVYVRAYFFDNFEAFKLNTVVAGTWLGGYDLTGGFQKDLPLQPLTLTAGTGLEVGMPLIALRALRVNLSMVNGKSPLGDGQGPAGALLFKNQQLAQTEPAFGTATAPCLDLLAQGGGSVRGILFGNGPYYALGFVEDFGLGSGSGLPAGTVVDVTSTGTQTELPASSLITYAADAYTITKDLQLDYVIPFTGTVPADTVQCVADGGVADGGVADGGVADGGVADGGVADGGTGQDASGE